MLIYFLKICFQEREKYEDDKARKNKWNDFSSILPYEPILDLFLYVL